MEQKPVEKVEQKPAAQAPASQQPAGEQQPKNNNKIVLIIVAVVVVLGVIGLAGGYFVMRGLKTKVSQKIGENIMEKAIEHGTGQKADVSSDGNSVSVKTDSGTWSTSEAGNIKLPSDFPSDVFVYSDAKITFATSTQANPADGTKASFMIGYNVNQSADNVVNKYRDEMAKNGWTKETEANYGAMMINFKKGTREALVTIADSQDGQSDMTGVTVAISEN
ncbi:MAG: hypothetical protein WC858_06020 [Parcubacteria group bacterium]|jgi:hypothetical protein